VAGVGLVITGLFTELFDGRNEKPSDGVRAALGREPRSFADTMITAFTTTPARPRPPDSDSTP
jgi:hypothetical protein